MEEKNKLPFPEDNQEKIAKQNDNFLLNPFFRVQKELWTESLAYVFQQKAHQGHLSCLRFAFYFADFIIIDPIHCPFWGIFSTWMADLSFSEYLFYLLVFFSLFFITFFPLTCSFWVALRNVSYA